MIIDLYPVCLWLSGDSPSLNEIVRPDGSVFYQWKDDSHAFVLEIADKEAAALLRRAFTQYEGWTVGEYAQVEALGEKLGVG